MVYTNNVKVILFSFVLVTDVSTPGQNLGPRRSLNSAGVGERIDVYADDDPIIVVRPYRPGRHVKKYRVTKKTNMK